MNRYEVFLKVVEHGSFTRAAAELSYSQSAVSQMVKALETELETVLLARRHGGVALTYDGEQYLPFIRAICEAHDALRGKKASMLAPGKALVRVGTTPAISRNWLPGLMREFRDSFPGTRFELTQGEYTNICEWIEAGVVDFGFLSAESVGALDNIPLLSDDMHCILPPGHHLCKRDTVTLAELSCEPYILLDEGKSSVPLREFSRAGLEPDIQYKVYDDRTIKAMVEQGMGVSILSSLALHRRTGVYEIRPISPPIVGTIAIAYVDKQSLPPVCRGFIDLVVKRLTGKRAFLGMHSQPKAKKKGDV